MTRKKYLVKLFIILWIALIWGHSLQPADVSSSESGFFLSIIGSIFPSVLEGDLWMFLLRKAAHATEYLILGFLITLDIPKMRYGFWQGIRRVLMAGLCIAFLDETIQLFVVGRSGEIRDVWIDVAGTLVGTVICSMIFRRYNHEQETEDTGKKGNNRFSAE